MCYNGKKHSPRQVTVIDRSGAFFGSDSKFSAEQVVPAPVIRRNQRQRCRRAPRRARPFRETGNFPSPHKRTLRLALRCAGKSAWIPAGRRAEHYGRNASGRSYHTRKLGRKKKPGNARILVLLVILSYYITCVSYEGPGARGDEKPGTPRGKRSDFASR